jgi:hypothetical protein
MRIPSPAADLDRSRSWQIRFCQNAGHIAGFCSDEAVRLSRP